MNPSTMTQNELAASRDKVAEQTNCHGRRANLSMKEEREK